MSLSAISPRLKNTHAPRFWSFSLKRKQAFALNSESCDFLNFPGDLKFHFAANVVFPVT